MTLDELRSRIPSAGPIQHSDRGPFFQCLCPVHGDTHPSYEFLESADGKLLGVCRVCPAKAPDVLAHYGLDVRVLFPDDGVHAPVAAPLTYVAEYDYLDEQGTLLFQVRRRIDKKFVQRRPDPARPDAWVEGRGCMQGVRLVPYRLLELAALRPPHLYVVEGEKDADALWALGLPATTNPAGAGKWRDEYSAILAACGVQSVTLLPDNDGPGRDHMAQVATACAAHGLTARTLALPGLAAKGDVSDWIAAGGTRVALEALRQAPEPDSITLEEVHNVFRQWLGEDYDLQVLDAVLATAASQFLGGDPCWLLVIGGSGAAKTETLMPLMGAGAIGVSTITSTAALLSGTARRERAADATGGLLRRIGQAGLLVIKDVTSILSMDRTSRATLLAALREVHDGKWSREIGTEGGRVLTWEGRLTVVGACTGAWDRQHEVVATMGDRFVLVRVDSRRGRRVAAMKAHENIGREAEMREALATAVAGLLERITPQHQAALDPEDHIRIYNFANLLALARTPVETDFREDVVFAHSPEMPTRVQKQLYQLIRGATAIGMTVPQALNLAARCAIDSIPPLRRAILDDLSMHPRSKVQDVRRRIIQPYMTVKRQLMALEILRLVGREGIGDDDEGGLYYVTSEANMAFFKQKSVTMDQEEVDEYGQATGVTINVSPLPQTHQRPVESSDVPF